MSGRIVAQWSPAALVALLLFSLSPGALAGQCPRVVSQSPFISDIVDYLDAGGCLVGASRFDRRDLPETGSIMEPDAEAIRAREPDLVITSSWTEEGVLEAAVPEGVRTLYLDPFDSMEALEDSVEEVARALGREDAAGAFARQWRSAAESVPANGERILLLSSCGEQPYSFGPRTWLHDAFEHAGFDVREQYAEGVRHFSGEHFEAELAELVEKRNVDTILVFRSDLGERCRAIRVDSSVRVLNLRGRNFLHPAPVLVDGLRQLGERDGWRNGEEVK